MYISWAYYGMLRETNVYENKAEKFTYMEVGGLMIIILFCFAHFVAL